MEPPYKPNITHALDTSSFPDVHDTADYADELEPCTSGGDRFAFFKSEMPVKHTKSAVNLAATSAHHTPAASPDTSRAPSPLRPARSPVPPPAAATATTTSPAAAPAATGAAATGSATAAAAAPLKH
mmetsp:Transcript_4273/g.7494  ORF Transcript_4273/g.7494 Transcript_4273/m.7494 type:complete len:127 (+) Transcript_4273:1-381(+)